MDPHFAADLARCTGPGRPLLREQSLWAIWVYRYGRRVDALPPGWRRRLATQWYWLLARGAETLTGIGLPKSAVIGPGLRIWHFGGVFLHPNTVVGARCTLRQGVTLGNRTEGGPAPTLEDDVELGAYAQVLGGVRLGHGCKVGAMAVVLTDVPPGTTAVGNPARIVVPRGRAARELLAGDGRARRELHAADGRAVRDRQAGAGGAANLHLAGERQA